MAQYICKNGHKADYPNVGFEAMENKNTKEFEGHFLCEKCEEEMKIDGEKIG